MLIPDGLVARIIKQNIKKHQKHEDMGSGSADINQRAFLFGHCQGNMCNFVERNADHISSVA